MRILVTGAAGCLGRHVVQLCRGVHETVALDVVRPPGGDTVLVGSVTDRDLVFDAVAGCDAVIHPAGLNGHHRRTHSTTQFLEVNITGTNNVYEAMVEHGVKRMVMSSTMEVVLGSDWLANGLSVLDEDSPPKPNWIYPQTKWMAELLAPYYLRHHGITTAIFRYMSFDDRDWMSLGLALVARWMHPNDVADANLRAASSKAVGADVFHLGPENELTNQDLYQTTVDNTVVLERYWPGSVELLRAHGVELTNRMYPATSCAKARRLLGWAPKYTFSRYLEKLAATPRG